MTRYLASSDEVPTPSPQPVTTSILQHKRFRGTAWSVATMTFAIGVGWLIFGSLMI